MPASASASASASVDSNSDGDGDWELVSGDDGRLSGRQSASSGMNLHLSQQKETWPIDLGLISHTS